MSENEQESYNTYSVDDEDQLQADDTLVDRGVDDTLDEGYTAPESWSPGEGYGNTALEAEVGETLEQRMAQEVPEPDPYEQAAAEADNEDVGGEVGDGRAGRLVAQDEGLGADLEKDLIADEVGIDGAAASAEEAAVHVVDEE
ncbi:MAG TPA: DUF5709 domain-containing protein [Nocardioidaceae bacterium]|nr:DUF5709 domain-containing protein [Nocardioidaceae bacterium]